MRGSSRDRQGIFLPVVVVIAVLVAASVLLLSRFGSGTRAFLEQVEGTQRCRLAAASALLEARRSVEQTLRSTTDVWDPFWKGLLPAVATDPLGPYTVIPEATVATYVPSIVVDPVTIACLHRSANEGTIQGLLSFRGEVAWRRGGAERLRMSREERVGFIVHREALVGLRLILIPGHVCLEEEKL